MNIISRIFCYPILERELTNRIADRDTQIVSLKIEVQELRDRLFLVRGVPAGGSSLSSSQAQIVPSYMTGRQRLRKLVTPQVGLLTPEEEKVLEESVTQ